MNRIFTYKIATILLSALFTLSHAQAQFDLVVAKDGTGNFTTVQASARQTAPPAQHAADPTAQRAAPPAQRAATPKRLTVAQDGSGDYRTVQAALDAIPPHNSSKIIIYIKKGLYREKLHLDSTKNQVQLLGEDRFNTILTYDDHPGMVSPKGDSINTRSSYSFLIQADDFGAKNLSFRNDAGFTTGQAVALEVRGDHAVFTSCRIIGNQDILFLNSPASHQYYRDCYIEGTTDFIFGAATAWFENCHIHSKKNSHVTAASTPQDHPYGFIFNNCILTGDSSIHSASLGRPWRPYASVIYLHCYIDRHIRPDGWSTWNNTDSYKFTRFSEYKNDGPGGDPSTRLSWSRQLTDAEAQHITLSDIFGNWSPEIICN